MLTKHDINNIGTIVDERLDGKLEEKLTEKLQFLPTKEEFFGKMDEVMGELQSMREEIVLVGGRLAEHSDTV